MTQTVSEIDASVPRQSDGSASPNIVMADRRFVAQGLRANLTVAEKGPYAVLWLAVFAAMASMRCTDSILLTISHAFAAKISSSAFVISTFAAGYGLFQLAIGPLSNRFRYLFLVTVATMFCVFTALSCAFSLSLGWLQISRFASGVAAAGVVPLTMAWIADRVEYSRRQGALAQLLGATIGGTIFGQWISAFAAETFGWRSVFLLSALLFASVTVLLIREGGLSGARQRHEKAKGPAALSSSWMRIVLTLAFFEGALAFGALAFVPMHLHTRFGLSLTQASAILVMYGVGGLAYSATASRLLRHLNEKELALIGGCVFGLGMITLGTAPSWALTVMPCALAGFGFYALHGTLQTQATQMVPEARGTAMSYFSCVLFLGQSVGVLSAALISSRYSPNSVLWTSGLGLLALSLVFAWLLRTVVTKIEIQPVQDRLYHTKAF